MASEAKFILVIKKFTAFTNIADAQFYNYIPCIIITGKGQPGCAPRWFLQKLRYLLMLPIFGLFDCNPYGLGIHFMYKHGSRKLAFDNETLVTPDIKWIGVMPADKLKLEEQVMAELTDSDEGRLDRL